MSDPQPDPTDTPLTLVLLAAGAGTRFGGPKQLEPVGANDEPVFAITAKQAARAGFERLVIVTTEALRPRIEDAAERFVDNLAVDVVCQDAVPPLRTPPWGTAHAVAVCQRVIRGPFGVANGDDLYGDPSFDLLADALRSADHHDRPRATIVSFELARVLSPNGGVSRGICDVADDGRLRRITETHQVRRRDLLSGPIVGPDGTVFAEHTPTSMNLWGVPSGVIDALADGFETFRAHASPDAEYQFPTELARMADAGKLDIAVVASSGPWLGLTHRDELPTVRAALRSGEFTYG